MTVFALASAPRGVVGGLMIGAAAAAMLLGLGRIAGVSGLAARAAGLAEAGLPRWLAGLFLAGLPIGAIVVSGFVGPLPSRFPASFVLLIAGGLLVGIGTRLGSGCTSGHGVCGVSRLSPRSIVATLTFMTSGAVAVAAMRGLGVPW